MKQAQGLVQNGNQARAGGASFRRISFCGDRRLGKFNVPIAEVVPEKVIKRLHRAVKIVSLQLSVDGLRGNLVQPRKDPPIVQRQTLSRSPPNGSSEVSAPSAFIKQKRAAFQILLAKLR